MIQTKRNTNYIDKLPNERNKYYWLERKYPKKSHYSFGYTYLSFANIKVMNTKESCKHCQKRCTSATFGRIIICQIRNLN